MSQAPDPEEMAIADLGVFRYRLVKHFEADGVIDSTEHELVQLFDEPHKKLSLIYRLRNTLEGFIRNGVTRRMKDKAKDVGLTIVVDANGYPNNLRQFPGAQETQPQQA